MKICLENQQQKTVEDNLKLVYHIVINNFGIYQNDSIFDDVVSSGMVGLCKAASTFDTLRGIRFSSYASKCIKNEICMYFKNDRYHKGTDKISLYTPVYSDSEDENLQLKDFLYDNCLSVEDQLILNDQICKSISIILNCLPLKQAIMSLYTFAGYNQEDIGRFINVTQSDISRMMKKNRVTLKKYIDTNKCYSETISIELTEGNFKFTFYLKEFNCQETLKKVLLSLANQKEIYNFGVNFTNKHFELYLPAECESFAMLAKFIQACSTYSESSKWDD